MRKRYHSTILRGLGLIEAMLFSVVAAGLLIGGIVFYQQSSESARVSDAVRSIIGIQSGVRSLYVGARQFGPEGTDLGEAAIAAGAVDSGLIGVDGSIVNQWGGAVSVIGYHGGFTIDYGDMPQEACVRLAPHTVQGTGLAGTGIAAVAINGLMVDADGDGLVDPEEAAAACELPLSVEPVAEPIAMRWAFVPGAVGTIERATLEDMLGVEGEPTGPVETGRSIETEASACPTGSSGEQTRQREIIAFSDGSQQVGTWTDWNTQACVPLTVTGTTAEVSDEACPAGMFGRLRQQREVTSWSDGSVSYGPWFLIEQCMGPEDLRFSYNETTLQSSTKGCSSSQMAYGHTTQMVHVFNNGTVVRDELIPATMRCAAYEETYEYRACQSHDFGQESRRISLERIGPGIAKKGLTGWTSFSCRD